MSQTNLNESTRDIQLIISSIAGMTLDAPPSLIITFNIYSNTSGISVVVWEDTVGGKTLLHKTVYLNWKNSLEDAVELESKLAELIIEARDNAEVAA
ncbi:hypothetical protein GNP81_10195 [Aliivibrio fischeri]|uniref:hypothetical protein n=1 Tax=Aliivibrio fischeri TaxID=668 RepID=UPI0012D9B36A|nr:hypothetical protein [Aliivibrio fischeri]MUK63274.1 hypothetical protein [Aliivibrio fischeri]MUL20109.1 hypothetical protein [Aliivibrio fischeri]MUL24972.1 hypothetical protein [Aliivibrio fischeri]